MNVDLVPLDAILSFLYIILQIYFSSFSILYILSLTEPGNCIKGGNLNIVL